MKKYLIIALMIISILILSGCAVFLGTYDKEFRDYLENNYNLELDNTGYVGIGYGDCEYYGFYTVDKDYNYAIQIAKYKDNDEFYVSYDQEAISKRRQLLQYIQSKRGDSFASNFIGFYKNTQSGKVSYSSIEGQQLYYIIKYNDNMDFEEELKKDYDILLKAQEILGTRYIKEMIVLYIKDGRLNDKDWVTKLPINDLTDNSFIIFDSEKYLNKPKYQYRISNYKSDTSLANISFEEFKALVAEKLES